MTDGLVPVAMLAAVFIGGPLAVGLTIYAVVYGGHFVWRFARWLFSFATGKRS